MEISPFPYFPHSSFFYFLSSQFSIFLISYPSPSFYPLPFHFLHFPKVLFFSSYFFSCFSQTLYPFR
ncbi:MAG: hypothetical protein C6I01_06055 [Epsilonproteobacteria bacterium]|nr:hypothetical protein [Campylobacterota bacterium]